MGGTSRKSTIDSIVLGMNNRRPDFKLEKREGGRVDSFVRAAVNTDITAEGSAKRRRGYANFFSGARCHSLWANATGTQMFFADGTELKRVTGSLDAPAVTTVATGLSAAPLSLVEDPTGQIYYTDGVQLRVISSGADRPLGTPMMGTTPLAAASSGGALTEGRYQLAATFVGADGQESGSTQPQSLEVAADGAITITGLPAAWPAGVTGMRLYLTTPNGATLMRAHYTDTPTTSFTFASLPLLGARCPSVLLVPMPAGQIVRIFNGRLLVASGSMLVYSEPWAFALRNPSRNYIPFSSQITMLEVCDDGFYVAADNTYWVGNDITASDLTMVRPFGAVPRTGAAVPNSTDVWWMSERGRMLGKNGGEVASLEEENVAVPRAQSGASLFRETDGMKQAVTSLLGLETTQMAAGSFMSAEVIRKRTTL